MGKKCFNIFKFGYYLFNKPLAEGRTDPLSSMDATVNPHGFLMGATSLS